jgi:hypothetical protein
MKNLFILIFLTGLGFSVAAQSKGSAKLYGFKEGVTAGRSPGRAIDESGKEKTAGIRTSYNYFIYLVSAAQAAPTEIWIGGKPYAVTTKKIDKTPVERKNYILPGHPKTTVLVPRTKQKVLTLLPAPATHSKLSEKARALARTNELVVVYTINGRSYYSCLSSLTELEPVATQ